MSKLKKNLVDIRTTQFSDTFVKQMENRVLTSYFKYGSAKDHAPVADFPTCAKQRIDRYLEDGNTEWLVDAANFAMLEYMYPQHPKAHFKATSSAESPGIAHRDGTQWHGLHGKDEE